MRDVKNRELKLGIYEYYKGKKYKVLGVALHSETLEKLVVYQTLYGEKKLWARPLKMFLGKVKVQSKVVPRFKSVSVNPRCVKERRTVY